MEKWGKVGKNIVYRHFLFYLKETQMMPISKISFRFLKKKKTGVQNVFKLVKDTLPFKHLYQAITFSIFSNQ